MAAKEITPLIISIFWFVPGCPISPEPKGAKYELKGSVGISNGEEIVEFAGVSKSTSISHTFRWSKETPDQPSSCK